MFGLIPQKKYPLTEPGDTYMGQSPMLLTAPQGIGF